MTDKEKAKELYPPYSKESHLTASELNFQNSIKRLERKAFIQGSAWKEQQMIEKAVEWMKEIENGTTITNIELFIEDFKKATMEE